MLNNNNNNDDDDDDSEILLVGADLSMLTLNVKNKI